MELDMQKYIKVRMAQCKGARTIDELMELSDIVIENEKETVEIKKVLKSACSCHNLSIDDVLKVIENGADTMEKLTEATKMGTSCGRCKQLAQNIVENRR